MTQMENKNRSTLPLITAALALAGAAASIALLYTKVAPMAPCRSLTRFWTFTSHSMSSTKRKNARSVCAMTMTGTEISPFN